MDNVLFIVPPHITWEDFVNPAQNARVVTKRCGGFGSVLTEMPLGVLSMSAYLKHHAMIEVRLIDFNVLLNKEPDFTFSSFAAFYEHVLSSPQEASRPPAIVCISALFTPCYRNMLAIGECCRRLFPAAVIVAGGGVPTNMYRDIFRDSGCFDALCFGEGEKPLLDLARSADRLQFLESNPSWITRRKAEHNESFRHDVVADLDEIPFYDYDLCAPEDYGLNPAVTAYAAVDSSVRTFHVMTSRGCPHRCCFCSSHTVHGREVRFHSLERVRADFMRLRDRLGARTLVFQDDHFMADRLRARQIVDVVRDLRLTAVFQNGLALYALDRPFLEAMKGAGVHQLMLSIESGSNRVLREIMHKPLDVRIARRVATDCRSLGIYTNVNVLIGLPGERKDDIEETRAFLKTVDANWFMIFCANPLVGSEMFETCVKRNYLKNGYVGSDYKKAIVETEDFTAEYIQDMAYALNLELNFVLNSDFRLGHIDVALMGFENAIRARSDHAFAYHFAGRCHERLGNTPRATEHLARARAIAAEQPFWRDHAARFGIVL